MKLRLTWCLALLPLLGGCIDDAASWQIDGREHALTLIREQTWFWVPTVQLYVVAARLPDCQRRHKLTPASASQATVEVFMAGENTYVLRQGARLYVIETTTCEGFRQLDAEPPGGIGIKVGTFRESGDRLRFVVEAVPAKEAPVADPLK